MMHVRDFVADLGRAGKGYLEIKEMVETVYGDKGPLENINLRHHQEGVVWTPPPPTPGSHPLCHHCH